MNMRPFTFALPLILIATLASAAPFTAKTSPHDVATTMDRLAAAVEAAGATIVARIDHAAAAEKVGLELAPNQVLIFGNPKLGTPMMQSAPSMGLDLPLKVQVYRAADGTVQVVYRSMDGLAAEHGADSPALGKAAGALDKLTGKAIAAE
jgi:uncharacterized protein (DUF302 family)